MILEQNVSRHYHSYCIILSMLSCINYDNFYNLVMDSFITFCYVLLKWNSFINLRLVLGGEITSVL